MKTFLKLTVAFSITLAIMLAPSIIISWLCINSGISIEIILALCIPSALLGLFIGIIAFEFFLEQFVD